MHLRVYPALVPSEHMLAKVDGVYNAVEVAGSLCGQVLFHGMGAGREPTTSAVVGDLIEVVRSIGSHATQPGAQDGRSPGNGVDLAVRPIGDLQARYYIRLDVVDHPGVLAQIAQVLGDGQISIAAVLQRDTPPETESAEIVITTHPANEASMQNALKAMAGLDQVRRVSNMIRIEE